MGQKSRVVIAMLSSPGSSRTSSHVDFDHGVGCGFRLDHEACGMSSLECDISTTD